MVATNRRVVLLLAAAAGVTLAISPSAQSPFDIQAQIKQMTDQLNIQVSGPASSQMRGISGTVVGIAGSAITVAEKNGVTKSCSLDARTPVAYANGHVFWTQPHIIGFDDLLKNGDKVNVGCYSLGGSDHASAIMRFDPASTVTTPHPSVSQPPVPLPSSVVDPEKTLAVVPVFFATDRVRVSYTPLTYSSARDTSEKLHLGRYNVSIPRDHHLGEVERPNIWTFEKESQSKHLTFVGRTELTYTSFYGEIKTVLAKTKSQAKEAFVFIHGFNVPFDDAVYQTAQMSYDLGFDGAPILYSWPSKGELADYRVDEKENEWTIDHLRWFLEDLRGKSGADVVHLVAHSMGNRPLIRVLDTMVAGMPAASGIARIGEVVMTAPDVEVGVFMQIVRRITNRGRRLTLYVNGSDKALQAAHKYDTFQRAGDTNPRIVILQGVDTVDATTVQTGLVNHSYFRENRSVISDIFYVVKGIAAKGRFSIVEAGRPPDHFIFKQ